MAYNFTGPQPVQQQRDAAQVALQDSVQSGLPPGSVPPQPMEQGMPQQGMPQQGMQPQMSTQEMREMAVWQMMYQLMNNPGYGYGGQGRTQADVNTMVKPLRQARDPYRQMPSPREIPEYT